MFAPTTKQLRVLGLIVSAIEHQGYPPTLREMANVLGYTGTNAVSDHLRGLNRKGLVKFVGEHGQARNVLPTDEGYAAFGVAPRKLGQLPRCISKAPVVPVRTGWRCQVDGCDAVSFDPEKPCPVCAIAAQGAA
jgi:repressor LexA